MNAPRTKPATPEKEATGKKRSTKALPLHLFDPSNFLQIDFLRKHIRFIFFLFFLMMLYIGNANMNESRLKRIASLEDSIKNARRDYIYLKAELTKLTRESQVARVVEDQQLKIVTQSPRKIYVKSAP